MMSNPLRYPPTCAVRNVPGTNADVFPRFALAALRCCPRTVPELRAMQAPETGLQDRVQLQAHWEEVKARRDGEGDRAPPPQCR